MAGHARQYAEMAVKRLARYCLHDEQLVEQAISKALELGEPSKEHVLNCLSRLEEQPRPQPLKPPPALKLVTEPEANTSPIRSLKENPQ